MVAAGLESAGGGAGVAGSGAAVEADLRRAAELAGDDDEDALVEAAGVDVLDQGGDGAVVVRHAETEGLELVLVHGVVVPVADASTEGTAQAARDDLDAGLDEAAGEEELLAPAVAAVAVADRGVFLAQVEGVAGLRIGEQGHGLALEFIEGAEFALLVEGALELVEALAQGDAVAEAARLGGVAETDVRHGEIGAVRVVADREGGVGVAEVGGAVVFEGRVDPDVVRERVAAFAVLGPVMGHRHPVGEARLRFVAFVAVAREHLHRASGVAAGLLVHRAHDRELSAIFAFIGSSSVSCMPGTLVEIVLKGPRYSLPMSGFGS